MKAKIMKETIPFYLSKFEKIVSENNGFSVGNSVSKHLFFFHIKIGTASGIITPFQRMYESISQSPNNTNNIQTTAL